MVAADIISDQFVHFLPINFGYPDFAHTAGMWPLILTTAGAQVLSNRVTRGQCQSHKSDAKSKYAIKNIT